MDNKLSELSTPVAWRFKEYVWSNICGYIWRESLGNEEPEGVWEKDIYPLYSQEYVSALMAELEAKDERIAELEGIEKKLCAANVTLDARASAAEAKLATPVRLLGEMLPHEWERAERQAAFDHRKIAWDARLAEDKKAILAAGFTFTVEGGE
ncbi:hypothetical protein HLB02_22185 [Serratia nevei]|nr:hypothetical protein [Serratia nevei]